LDIHIAREKKQEPGGGRQQMKKIIIGPKVTWVKPGKCDP